MNLVRVLILAAGVFVLSVAGNIAFATENATERPDWCRQGYSCIKTSELVVDSEFHLDLREQVIKYKSRARRFGLTIGFGLGVGGVVDDDFDVHWTPTAGCFLVYGIRF